MIIALVLLALAAALLAAVFMLGKSLPIAHEASLAQMYSASPATLYRLIRNMEGYPGWRTGIKSVERDAAGRYIEESAHGKIPYKIVVDLPEERMVALIDDSTLPFSGQWTFELSRQGGLSKLIITEQGKVPNPFMRFIAHYVFSHEKTIRVYLADLAQVLEAGGLARK